MQKPPQRPPATLADAIAGTAVSRRDVLAPHIMARCDDCGRVVQLLAAGLVADGVPATTPILEAGKRLRCSVCGSKSVNTWPKLRMSKRVDARN